MSYSAVRPDGVAVYPAIEAATEDRLGFIRKVYSLMFLGLVVFAASIALPVYGIMAGIPLLGDIGILATKVPPLVAFGAILLTSWLVHSVSMVRGLNVIAMFGLAAFWGFLSIPLVAYAIMYGGGVSVVFQALFLTCMVFGGLTAYVFITRKDFSFMGGMLSMGLFLLIGVVFVGIIGSMMAYEMNMLSMALSIFAVVLFSGYVLYDTSNLLHRYSTDMVVPAALALMVDFIILFRSILFLLMASRD